MVIHQIRLPLVHLAAVCMLSLGLQFYYRSCIIVIVPMIHLAALCCIRWSPGFQIFYFYNWAPIIFKAIIQPRVWLPIMLLLTAVCILSLSLQTSYNRFLSSFSLNGRFYPSGESSFFYDEGFLCTGWCRAAARYREHVQPNYPRCCEYKHVRKLKELSTWKIALLVLALLTLILAIYLLIWHVIRKRRHNRPYPRWVNGDMKRSPSRDTKTATRGNTSPDEGIAVSFGQLCCMIHGHQETAHISVGQPGVMKMTVFDYGMLASATCGFGRSSMLASVNGISSGAMYRGTMISNEGMKTTVVIKRFNLCAEACKNALENLNGQLVLRHRNLLGPLGYCLENNALFVVYEYMVNRSLDQHLFPNESIRHERLSWPQRCRIIKGAAAGLHYLHKNVSIHGSIKASNILLDQDMTPCLGDFGFSTAAFYPSSAQDFSTESAADVFSFGTVIIDVLCGERWNEERHKRSIPAFSFLVDRAWDVDGNACILGAIDADLAEASDFDQNEAEKILQVSLACSHPDSTQRPSMEEVIDFLTGKAALLEVPLKHKDC